MKWKFENIETIFTCKDEDFERTSNYSRIKLNTNDRIIHLDGGVINGNSSINPEPDLLDSAENNHNTNEPKPRRKTAKMSDVLTILDDVDSITDSK